MTLGDLVMQAIKFSPIRAMIARETKWDGAGAPLTYRSALGVEVVVSNDGDINSARDGFLNFVCSI